jgi:hypothetical protein
MRDNLIFYNIPGTRDEETTPIIHKLLEEKMGMKDATKNIKIDRSHRLGRPKPGASKPQPIVAKFNYHQDRETIRRNAMKLRGTNIGIGEQFPAEIVKARKELYPELKKAKHNKNSLNLFSDEIEHLSWEGTISSNNPCESFNQFSMLFTSSYEKNFPIKRPKVKMNINKHRSPWMTKCVLKSIKKKNKLYKKYLSDSSKINENVYKKYKNKLNHVIRLSKKNYYEQELTKYKHDSKMMWKTLNEIINRKQRKRKSQMNLLTLIQQILL